MTDAIFQEKIAARYPEGLTGIFAIGGTRTTYILEQNRFSNDPGRIDDFTAQGEFLQHRYQQFIQMFFDLGGQNMLIGAFSFLGFYNRGEEYAQLATAEMFRMMDDHWVAFYRDHYIDPYFVGIDTLLSLPEQNPGHALGKAFADFQQRWDYQPGRRKVIWEIASIPLVSLWDAYERMPAADKRALRDFSASTTDLEALQREYYRVFARIIFGTDVPMPHFYLGTNKSGDLKLRAPMPLALLGGEFVRLYYTPYPTLFLKPETLKAILSDLAFNDRFFSDKVDYAGKYTPSLVQAEYERVQQLASDPDVVLGYSRRVQSQPED
jgi:hypothetical protein